MVEELTSIEMNKKILRFNELLKQKKTANLTIIPKNKEKEQLREIKEVVNGIKRAKGNSTSMLVTNAYRLAHIQQGISCPICRAYNSKIKLVELIKQKPLRGYFDCLACGMGFFHAEIGD